MYLGWGRAPSTPSSAQFVAMDQWSNGPTLDISPIVQECLRISVPDSAPSGETWPRSRLLLVPAPIAAGVDISTEFHQGDGSWQARKADMLTSNAAREVRLSILPRPDAFH